MLVGEGLKVLRNVRPGGSNCPPEFPAGSDTGKAYAQLGITRCWPGEPAHFEMARVNIDEVLGMIEDIKIAAGFEDLDDWVKFRLGHATHATVNQAIKMRELGVGADINLASNLVTGALKWFNPPAEVLFQGDPWSTGYVHAGREEIFEYRDLVVYRYGDSGYLPLILAGTETYLGTDGAGVEHSDLHQAYDIIDAMLMYYYEMGPAAAPSADAIAAVPDDHAYQLTSQRVVRALFGVFGDTRACLVTRGERKTAEVLMANQRALSEWLSSTP